jgi:C4-type Zn-finger protein
MNLFIYITEITTIEGILSRCIAGLEQDQPVRKALDCDSAEKIEAFIQVLIDTKKCEKPFTIVSLVILQNNTKLFQTIYLGYR